MQRRELLGMAGGAAVVQVLGPIGTARADTAPPRMVVVMLRGAVDGLNVVVPHGEAAYYESRSTIAIPKPGAENGALPLDEHFALHPSLAGLMPLWTEKKLAFIHAAGSPDPSRSHFDAQQYIENGTPGRTVTPDGWMNRALAALPGPRTPTDALAVGPTLPYILKGQAAVANLPLGPRAAQPTAIDKPEVASQFDKLYAGNDRQSIAYRQGREARTELVADMSAEQQMADNGAPPAGALPALAGRLSRLMTQDQRIRFGFASLGGWDTHVRQGTHAGQLANKLKPLGDGLAALAQGLGVVWNDTVVVVISEFGRTVHENGNRGTDHGHGNVIWVMGGPVKGGKIYGEWPGLAAAQLYQGRDLAVTTDYRHPLALILERHLRLPDAAMAKIFPDMPASRGNLAELFSA
ncbi:MAG TPA: DUF1501 domain-containing protein, partial [Xanthobacteraceae bacterium]|nr:DUF1501 domain-containing protein [Xanthobacteraceae bacterium]